MGGRSVNTTDTELRDAVDAVLAAWQEYGFRLNGHARLETAMEVLEKIAASERTNWVHEPCL
jgi:hypothetical protein